MRPEDLRNSAFSNEVTRFLLLDQLKLNSDDLTFPYIVLTSRKKMFIFSFQISIKEKINWRIDIVKLVLECPFDLGEFEFPFVVKSRSETDEDFRLFFKDKVFVVFFLTADRRWTFSSSKCVKRRWFASFWTFRAAVTNWKQTKIDHFINKVSRWNSPDSIPVAVHPLLTRNYSVRRCWVNRTIVVTTDNLVED